MGTRGSNLEVAVLRGEAINAAKREASARRECIVSLHQQPARRHSRIATHNSRIAALRATLHFTRRSGQS
jgi:hypothetical protein